MTERELGAIEEFINSHKKLHENLEATLKELADFKVKIIAISMTCGAIASLFMRLL